MRVDELLNYYYEDFSDNEKYVCHYLTEYYRDCVKKTIDEFASDCSVSKTLLVRFAKKLGLSGYSELKARLKIEMQEREGDVKGLLQTMTDSYHKMMDDLNKKNLTSFFEKLYSAERVFVFGSGSSQARAASEMKRIFLPAREIINLHGHDMCYGLKKNCFKQRFDSHNFSFGRVGNGSKACKSFKNRQYPNSFNYCLDKQQARRSLRRKSLCKFRKTACKI